METEELDIKPTKIEKLEIPQCTTTSKLVEFQPMNLVAKSDANEELEYNQDSDDDDDDNVSNKPIQSF